MVFSLNNRPRDQEDQMRMNNIIILDLLDQEDIQEDIQEGHQDPEALQGVCQCLEEEEMDTDTIYHLECNNTNILLDLQEDHAGIIEEDPEDIREDNHINLCTRFNWDKHHFKICRHFEIRSINICR